MLAGTRGRVAEVKNKRVRDLALKHKKPFIALMEAGAARVQETYGATAAGLALCGPLPDVGSHPSGRRRSRRMRRTLLYRSAIDFVPIVAGTGFLGMSGPPVVKVGIGLDTSTEEIGGGEISAKETASRISRTVKPIAWHRSAALRTCRQVATRRRRAPHP